MTIYIAPYVPKHFKGALKNSSQYIYFIVSDLVHLCFPFYLIQVGNHSTLILQFVLKHDRFRPLREVENCPMTICPLREGM